LKDKNQFKTDLIRRCYILSIKIINITDSLPSKRSSWVISDQLIRSTTSIGANLVEAKSSSSRLEFKKFHEIALKSVNETKYWLCLLKDAGLVNKETVDYFLAETIEISKMLASGIMKLKKKT